jgi:hypothetical protein
MAGKHLADDGRLLLWLTPSFPSSDPIACKYIETQSLGRIVRACDFGRAGAISETFGETTRLITFGTRITVTKLNFDRGLVVLIVLATSMAWADSLELKNGSLINGKFMGGTETEISFQVGSSVQKYDVADVASLKFTSEAPVATSSPRPLSVRPAADAMAFSPEARANLTIPSGTRLSIRTINAIDSSKNHPGDRFQASLEEPLTVDGNVVAAKGADVYGRPAESKKSGTFSGKSELQLELTGIVVNGQTVPLVTGEYEVKGKSRGASTAKRTIGGAAVGTLIGAIAGGGKGAGIGAAVGGGAGAGSEIITKGDQVKVPSETLLEFTLQQDVTITKPRA